ncbi:MAG: hypothetical protein IIA78_04995, partial [Proteobacteria bacterium]|nr:hypothetical protein [Pseudomonadota bacterium]
MDRERRIWSEEQREGGEEFFSILTECMETTSDNVEGYTCRCEDMPQLQGDLCFEIAPLADDCSKGNEVACEESDNIIGKFMDTLPNHLLEALEGAGDRFEEASFEHHVPVQCREAGAATRLECERV